MHRASITRSICPFTFIVDDEVIPTKLAEKKQFQRWRLNAESVLALNAGGHKGQLVAISFAMNRRRIWTEPVENAQAERHFRRFVRTISRSRFSVGISGNELNRASSVLGFQRRQDETTAMIQAENPELAIEEIRRRRLLGQGDLDTSLGDDERRSLVGELKALYRHGHLSDVLVELERVMSRYPNDLNLQGSLVDFFLERGDLVRGVEMLFRMVASHFERADLGAARRCLERVKNLDPENKRLQSYEKMFQR